MRKVNLYRIVALLQSVHSGFAVPVAHAVPRSRVCANAPNTIARTILDHRSSSHNIVWNAANSETSVTLVIGTLRDFDLLMSIITPELLLSKQPQRIWLSGLGTPTIIN
ncbi:MAG: hypothetical protein FRX48_03603 [Lasallia pustulata]|uniref:Secreted protein n=1 Tax=Lasallia pustulata TaxID=136370 RepID=A0A5M8PVB7_9LECA|nr:MAG: hypothetical protein FRX48_03603 [Lasallia pustulata]